MTRRHWSAYLLTAALTVIGSATVLASGASAATAQNPCSLLSAPAIQKVIHESVQDGRPNEFVPEACDYPLKPTTDLKRNFTVFLDVASQCPTKPDKGLTAIKVGRVLGFYDVRTRESTPKTEIHSPALYVKKGTSCVNVGWNLPSGPLPTGGRATTIRQQLVKLEALALKRLQP
ncbi:MAG: hypothetical protein MUP97_00045 [Acidimicrobiia bacterium]|nr:hypothetical protein [Acidimicrobiia bacterium]